MTLTPERIAEIADKGRARWDEREELCRLALLGLRVEEAPVFGVSEYHFESSDYPSAIVEVGTPVFSQVATDLLDKRVALVVIE